MGEVYLRCTVFALAGVYMRKGIGEAIGESNEPSVYYPKDLSFLKCMRDVINRLPRMYLVMLIIFSVMALISEMFSVLVTGSLSPGIALIGSLAVLSAVMPLIMIPIMLPFIFIYFKAQKVFNTFNRVFFEGSNIVIDHTEWPNSPWIRNVVPIASISLVTPAGQDYWESRKHTGTFSYKLWYGSHLPPGGGLYHSYSDPEDLFIIYLGKPQEIETPNRKTRMFHTIWSYKVWVKEIVIAVGKEHQEDFLRALNRKGVKIKRPRAEPQPTFIEKQALGGSVRFG
jgi:hypothetical protein